MMKKDLKVFSEFLTQQTFDLVKIDKIMGSYCQEKILGEIKFQEVISAVQSRPRYRFEYKDQKGFVTAIRGILNQTSLETMDFLDQGPYKFIFQDNSKGSDKSFPLQNPGSQGYMIKLNRIHLEESKSNEPQDNLDVKKNEYQLDSSEDEEYGRMEYR